MPAKWENCVEFERKWWRRWKGRADMAAVRKDIVARAAAITEILKSELPAGAKPVLLQVGPGANGEIHFLRGERHAIDPLAGFFRENFPELIDKDVDFIEGVGEKLPFKDGYFDAILIINVLDHCGDPSKVMAEMSRCLKKGGVIVMRINIYSALGSFLHKVFWFVDREHPYAITRGWLMKRFGDAFEVSTVNSDRIDLPDYDILKRVVLWVLGILQLEPKSWMLTARKK